MDEPFEPSGDASRHSLASLLLGIGVGALVGMAIAMLTAPQAGVETRQDLSEMPGKLKDRAEELITELKQNLDDLSAKSKELVDSTKSRVDAAIQAGKDAAQDKREELENQINSEPEPPSTADSEPV